MHESLDKMKKIKALINNGKGIRYTLSEVYKILGNPIIIHDRDYNALACTEDIVTDDPIWSFLITDKLKYDRIHGKLLDKDGITVGAATIVACHKPFEDDILELHEAVCDALSIELCQDNFYTDYGQAYLESLVSRLIEGRIEGNEFYYTAQVDSIYTDLGNNLYLAVMDIPKCTTDTQLEYFRDLFKRTQPAYKYFIYAPYILMIAGTNDSTFNVKKDLRKLSKIFSEHHIHVGVSGRFENLFKLQRYYIEAVDALNAGLKSGSRQRIFLHVNNTDA